MKKYFAILSLCFMAQSYAFSQGSPVISVIKNFPLCLSAGITYNEWTNVPAYLVENSARNEGFDLSLTHPFDTKKVQFIAGLGISVVDFHTNAQQWSFDSMGLPDGLVPASTYKENKMALTYFEIPLEIKYEPKGFRTNSFFISAGFKPGYCIDAHTKLVTDLLTLKEKNYDNIARWRYAATVRIGYGHFSLYGMYSIKSTFTSASDPNYFTPYSIGLVYSTLN